MIIEPKNNLKIIVPICYTVIAILIFFRLKYEMTGLLFIAGMIYLYTPSFNATPIEIDNESGTIIIKNRSYHISDFKFFKTKIEKRSIRFVTQNNKKIKINALSYERDLGDHIAMMMNNQSQKSTDGLFSNATLDIENQNQV